MEEGVKGSKVFILFLTAEASAPAALAPAPVAVTQMAVAPSTVVATVVAPVACDDVFLACRPGESSVRDAQQLQVALQIPQAGLLAELPSQGIRTVVVMLRDDEAALLATGLKKLQGAQCGNLLRGRLRWCTQHAGSAGVDEHFQEGDGGGRRGSVRTASASQRSRNARRTDASLRPPPPF